MPLLPQRKDYKGKSKLGLEGQVRGQGDKTRLQGKAKEQYCQAKLFIQVRVLQVTHGHKAKVTKQCYMK